MADFNAKDYEKFIDSEMQAARIKRMRSDSIQPGSHILVFNSNFAGVNPEREKTWHKVETLTRYSDGIVVMICTDGRKVMSDDVLLVANEKTAETLLICLNERQRELAEVMKHAGCDNLEIFSDWESDKFVVVNHDSQSEYRVTLKTIDLKKLASCGCKDFLYRNKICKHIGYTLRDALLGVQPSETVFLSASAEIKNQFSRR
ncbi:MAG TPA: SWIM zinc finger family protein [Pyrinomonadaceae bacterium]|jgi:hypothetical protein